MAAPNEGWPRFIVAAFVHQPARPPVVRNGSSVGLGTENHRDVTVHRRVLDPSSLFDGGGFDGHRLAYPLNEGNERDGVRVRQRVVGKGARRSRDTSPARVACLWSNRGPRSDVSVTADRSLLDIYRCP